MKRSARVSLELVITAHAFQRGKERLGLSAEPFSRMAMKAFVSGVKHKDTKGHLNKYISGLYLEHKKANNIRIYGEVLYLFEGFNLITVLHVPNDLKKYLSKTKK